MTVEWACREKSVAGNGLTVSGTGVKQRARQQSRPPPFVASGPPTRGHRKVPSAPECTPRLGPIYAGQARAAFGRCRLFRVVGFEQAPSAYGGGGHTGPCGASGSALAIRRWCANHGFLHSMVAARRACAHLQAYGNGPREVWLRRTLRWRATPQARFAR